MDNKFTYLLVQCVPVVMIVRRGNTNLAVKFNTQQNTRTASVRRGVVLKHGVLDITGKGTHSGAPSLEVLDSK